MGRARLHAAFADCRQADKSLLAFHSFREKLAHDHRNHGAEMADHRELILAWAASVNIAVATSHWTLARAKIGANDIKQRLAKCGAPCLVSNQRSEDVALLQKHSAGGA